MGCTVRLVDPKTKEPVKVVKHQEGSTVVIGGSTEADINITYNYAKFFYCSLDKDRGLRWLKNKKAAATVDRLRLAVQELGTVRDKDYWATTAGNAGYALSILLGWAEQHPNAVFKLDL